MRHEATWKLVGIGRCYLANGGFSIPSTRPFPVKLDRKPTRNLQPLLVERTRDDVIDAVDLPAIVNPYLTKEKRRERCLFRKLGSSMTLSLSLCVKKEPLCEKERNFLVEKNSSSLTLLFSLRFPSLPIIAYVDSFDGIKFTDRVNLSFSFPFSFLYASPRFSRKKDEDG